MAPEKEGDGRDQKPREIGYRRVSQKGSSDHFSQEPEIASELDNAGGTEYPGGHDLVNTQAQ